MGRRKIEIKRLSSQRARKATFAKRKHGLFKKAYELGVLTGCNVTVLITDENGIAKHGYSSESARSSIDYENIPLQNMIGPDSFQKAVGSETMNVLMTSPAAGSTTTPTNIPSESALATIRLADVPGLLERPNSNFSQDLVRYSPDVRCLDIVPWGLDFSFTNDDVDNLTLREPAFDYEQQGLMVPSSFGLQFHSSDEHTSTSLHDVFIDIPVADIQPRTSPMWGETSSPLDLMNLWPVT